jgi:hypothetical protein
MKFLKKHKKLATLVISLSLGALLLIGAGVEPLQSSYYQTTAVAASGVATTVDSHFLGIHGYNNNASAQFIQLYDSATVPADTTIPKIVFNAPGNSNFFFDVNTRGIRFQNGISWSNSSTLATKTIGAADIFVAGVEYRRIP